MPRCRSYASSSSSLSGPHFCAHPHSPPAIVVFMPSSSSASLPPGARARGRWRGRPLPFLWGTPLRWTRMANRFWCGILIHVKKGGEQATDGPKNNRHNPYKTQFLCQPNFWWGKLSCPFFCWLKKIVAKIGGNCLPFAPEKNCVWLFPWPRHATPRESNMRILPSWPLGLSFASHLFQPLCRLHGG